MRHSYLIRLFNRFSCCVALHVIYVIRFEMVSSEKKFPLLTEIDGQINADSIDWNKNAFETLRVCWNC